MHACNCTGQCWRTGRCGVTQIGADSITIRPYWPTYPGIQPKPKPLSADEVRKIVREELKRDRKKRD